MRIRQITTVALGLLFLLQVVPLSVAAPMPFPDMERSWYRYREAVDFLRDRSAIQGYPDGTFRPKDTINRAEFLKIVFTSKSDAEPILRRCFSDVPVDAWFAPYVCAAKQRGIVSGYPNGTFRPEEPVNFAEAIKIILNAYGHEVTEDVGKSWYVPYVDELEKLEILPRHAYVPWSPLNRERAADLLWRMLRHEEDRFVPRLSPGCGKASVALSTTLKVGDHDRTFLITVPPGYDSNEPTELIVAFHGRTNSNEQVQRYMRLDREATKSIIVYPAAIQNANGTFSWNDPGDKSNALRDIAFFDALVEHIAEAYCIDMDRIAVVGHSLGAWFANSLACVRGDVIMASATVGGDSVMTDCAGPAAAFIAHHPKDTLAPFSGAEKVLKQRKEANQCSDKTENTGPASLNCIRYNECVGGNEILWCPHTEDLDERGVYYPHHWPRETAGHIVEFLRTIP